MKIYTAIDHEQAVQLCGENVYSKFVKFKRLLKISFLIYADFESTVVPQHKKIENPDTLYTKNIKIMLHVMATK